jgi:hypothetical protein
MFGVIVCLVNEQFPELQLNKVHQPVGDLEWSKNLTTKQEKKKFPFLISSYKGLAPQLLAYEDTSGLQNIRALPYAIASRFCMTC